MMLLVFLCGLSFGQEPDAKLLKTVEDRFQPPPRFGTEVSEQPLRLPPPPVTSMNDIQRSPVVQKVLLPTSIIQELGTGIGATAEDRMFVNVHARPDDLGFFYLLSKENKITHRVHMRYVVDVRPDLALYEEPRHFSAITELKNVSPYDLGLVWRPEFSMLVGRTSADWTSDILNDTQARHSTGYKLGASWLADFPGKFQLGAIFQFEGATHRLRFGDASYRNYSIGVVAKTRTFDWAGPPWRIFVQVLTGPIGVLAVRVAQTREDIPMRTTSTVLGWEQPHRNALGEWSWGISWQRDWPKLRDQVEFVTQDSSSSTNDIVGLNLTQGFMW
jgi:hypothetical protein